LFFLYSTSVKGKFYISQRKREMRKIIERGGREEKGREEKWSFGQRIEDADERGRLEGKREAERKEEAGSKEGGWKERGRLEGKREAERKERD
jgi:hypothetical protein